MPPLPAVLPLAAFPCCCDDSRLLMRTPFLLSLVILAACSRTGAESSDRYEPARPGGSRSAQPAADNRAKMSPILPPNSTAASPQARIELNEYEIRMPDTLAAGHHSFTVVNSGKSNHGLTIEGNGMRTALPSALTRGDSAPLEVDLKRGTYTFYCPVDGHRGKGMTRTVTVQ